MAKEWQASNRLDNTGKVRARLLAFLVLATCGGVWVTYELYRTRVVIPGEEDHREARAVKDFVVSISSEAVSVRCNPGGSYHVVSVYGLLDSVRQDDLLERTHAAQRERGWRDLLIRFYEREVWRVGEGEEVDGIGIRGEELELRTVWLRR